MIKVIRVLLAERYPLMRVGMSVILDKYKDLELVGEATDGNEVQQLSQELSPDVLLLDQFISRQSLFETISSLHQHNPTIKILALIGDENDLRINSLIAAGVIGCVLKEESIETLIRAIYVVSRGDTWFSHHLIKRLFQENKTSPNLLEQACLTNRELEVLKLLAKGYSNNHIAENLVISERTVRFHVRNLYDKLHINTRSELLAWAIRESISNAW